MKGPRFLSGWTPQLRVNSIIFEINLWKKVEISLEEDGTKRIVNAEYKDDPCFPVIRVKGFNELNGFEEEFVIPCYTRYSEDSYDDIREEYERTGNSPAYSFPLGVQDAVFCQIINLQADLREAEEELKAEKALEKLKNDGSCYYLIGTGLVGKRTVKPKQEDYLFLDGKWKADEDELIESLLNGEDITKKKLKMFFSEMSDMINSISEIEPDRAFEIVADQTVQYLLMLWEKKYRKQKKEWDSNPQWFSKFVSISFTINGVKKGLATKDFPLKKGPSDDAFIEYISDDLKKDIEECGGFFTGMGGMID